MKNDANSSIDTVNMTSIPDAPFSPTLPRKLLPSLKNNFSSRPRWPTSSEPWLSPELTLSAMLRFHFNDFVFILLVNQLLKLNYVLATDQSFMGQFFLRTYTVPFRFKTW